MWIYRYCFETFEVLEKARIIPVLSGLSKASLEILYFEFNSARLKALGAILLYARNRLIWPGVPNLNFDSKLKIDDLTPGHNYTMGKKTGCSRPKTTRVSKAKFTQKKTHNHQTSTLVYHSGNQTSPKSKNS